jgi:type II secretory pathway pseudopilin PulG
MIVSNRQLSTWLRRQSGLTLIELLIVAFIIVLFVAIAVPLLRPASGDRKMREAARQLNSFFAEAKAHAAARGRLVAVYFDRSAAADEQARNTNIVTRLYLAQSPPIYEGDTLGDTVGATLIPRDGNMQPAVTLMQPPPWYSSNPPPNPNVPPSSGTSETNPPEINGEKARWYRLTFPGGSPMRNVIISGYLSQTVTPSYAPFRIRFNRKGPYFDGYVRYNGAVPIDPSVSMANFDWIAWAPKGKILPENQNVPFEIEFFPQITGDSVLELPTGTVVDLQFSGLGPQGTEFQLQPTDATPLMVVFSPGGEVEWLMNAGTMTNDVRRMHFLIGTLERAVDQTGLADSNLADPACQWVSVHGRSGHVTTADNLTPGDLSSFGAAVLEAREFAHTLNTKGGR